MILRLHGNPVNTTRHSVTDCQPTAIEQAEASVGHWCQQSVSLSNLELFSVSLVDRPTIIWRVLVDSHVRHAAAQYVSVAPQVQLLSDSGGLATVSMSWA